MTMSTSLPATMPEEPELLPREAEADFDLAEYLGWVRRWWRLVAATCLVAMAAGTIPWPGDFLDAEYYPTAYKQLGSRGLAERVVKRLGLPARLCRDRLRQADVRLVGAVLNRCRSKHAGRAQRYHSYETYVESHLADPADPVATGRPAASGRWYRATR